MRKIIILPLALSVIVVSRGFLIAKLLDGEYVSWLSDILGLLALLSVFQLVLSAFKHLTRNLPRMARSLLSASLFLFGFLPLLLVLVQIHPQRVITPATPSKSETVSFQVDGLTIRGWLIHPENSEPPILLTHGLNANRGNFLPIAERFAALGFPVLLFDFRAHGESDGWNTLFGLQEKSEIREGAAWLRRRYPERAPVAVAYSMGGAAVITAGDNLFERRVVDSTYASLRSVAERQVLSNFGPLKYPFWSIARLWILALTGKDISLENPKDLFQNPDGTTLLIHGINDRLISHEESVELQRIGGAPLWLIEGAGHLQTPDTPGYFEKVAAFLRSGTPPEGISLPSEKLGEERSSSPLSSVAD